MRRWSAAPDFVGTPAGIAAGHGEPDCGRRFWALAVYLETLADNGDPIPKEHSDKAVSLGIPVRTPVIA